MLKKSLVALTMLSTFVVASEMELVLEVGRDNTELSAKSQAKIDQWYRDRIDDQNYLHGNQSSELHPFYSN